MAELRRGRPVVKSFRSFLAKPSQPFLRCLTRRSHRFGRVDGLAAIDQYSLDESYRHDIVSFALAVVTTGPLVVDVLGRTSNEQTRAHFVNDVGGNHN
jgi:hypothetical protein